MDFISEEGLQGSFNVMREVVESLENNRIYKTVIPCEPQLGKRGLYPNVSQKGTYENVEDMVNFLGYADGGSDLIEISDLINVPVAKLIPIAHKLIDEDLIVEV